jgi:DHA1 family bicyclomycin/chloramphenicol resistance-like MFS transporter
MLFPLGYCSGNLISSRLSGRASIEKMVIVGSVICFLVVAAQSGLILAGYLSPLLIFLPGGLLSFAQGLSLPNAQAGAMRVKPELAGTAAGLGVFVQMLMSAVSTELYGLMADGTPIPMIEIAAVGVVLALVSAAYLMVKPSGPVAAAASS